MEAIPRKLVAAAAVILFGLALLGAYQGWRRSAVDEAQTAADGGLPLTTAAVAGARPASALVEAPPPPLSEAQVREIARQEARAALRSDSSAALEAPPPASGAAPAAPGAPRAAAAAPALAPPAAPVVAPPTESPPPASAPLF
jgi:hypothetical protein